MLRYSFVIILMAALLAVSVEGQQARRAKQRLVQFKKLKLIETLNMDEATAEKFFVVYNLAQNKIDSAKSALDSAVQNLHEAIEHSRPEDEIASLTDQVLQGHAAVLAAYDDLLRRAKQSLDTVQYARFIIFETKFNDEVRRRLMEIRGKPSRRRESRRP